MELEDFWAQSRVIIVAGKGGVGKTTVSGALARAAAANGRRVLLVDVSGQRDVPQLFGRDEPLGYEAEELWAAPVGPGQIRGMTLTPDHALIEYLEGHGLGRVRRRLTASGTLDVVATAVPGIKDILVLGKIKQLERAGEEDLIVVDAPAAGHAVTFLASARGLLDLASVGPIRTQARAVSELLADPARCQVLLVTLPEEMPVNELVDTAYQVEERAGVKLLPVVVNGVWPVLDLPPDPSAALADQPLPAAVRARIAELADLRARRQAGQAEQVARLADALPLPQIRLPYLFTTEIGADELTELAAALSRGIESVPALAS